MPLTVDLTGLDRLIRRFRALGDLDASELMRSWERIIDEDNRRGILAGTDKDGVAMAPTKYRPKPPPAYYKTVLGYNPSKLSANQRNNVSARRKRGEFGGFGPMAAGLHNNLNSSEYRYLTGPPLAPRKGFSRVITNFYTASGRDTAGVYRWVVVGAWREVVSRKGVPFLAAHFNGENGLPRRDLRGVRPEGMLKLRMALVEWMKSEIRRLSTYRVR